MSGFNEEAYNNYFGKKQEVCSKTENQQQTTQQFTENINKKEKTVQSISSDTAKYIADHNIDDIDQLGELLKKILNAAWGSDWGIISPDLQTGEDASNIPTPQIIFNTNSREVADKTPIKPVLTDTIKETVDGKETGEVFNIYRQWFDCIIEFDFISRNNYESRKLMSRFESLMSAYSGFLKRQGISDIFFLKEINPKQSINFLSGTAMKCLMYYIRLEHIQSVRVSTIENINLELANQLTQKASVSHKDPDYYNNSNITYNL